MSDWFLENELSTCFLLLSVSIVMSYIRTCEQDLDLGWIVLLIIVPAKVGIKSCRFARESVLCLHAWMYQPSWNCVCMIRCNAACRVGSQQFLS